MIGNGWHQYKKDDCIQSHLRGRAQEAAGAGGYGDAGVVEWDVGWTRAGAGLWVGPAPAEQTG